MGRSITPIGRTDVAATMSFELESCTMPTRVGTCHMCLRPDVELQESHIVPKWCYKCMRCTVPGEVPDPVMIGGAAFHTSRQVTEHLLCKNCERVLNPAETYVSRFGASEHEPSPLVERVARAGTWASLHGYGLLRSSPNGLS